MACEIPKTWYFYKAVLIFLEQLFNIYLHSSKCFDNIVRKFK